MLVKAKKKSIHIIFLGGNIIPKKKYKWRNKLKREKANAKGKKKEKGKPPNAPRPSGPMATPPP